MRRAGGIATFRYLAEPGFKGYQPVWLIRTVRSAKPRIVFRDHP